MGALRVKTRKARASKPVVVTYTSNEPLKAGPNAPQCPTCGLITPRSVNSLVNANYVQFYNCPKCNTRVTVPASKGSREADI